MTEAEQLAILERIPGFVRPSAEWLKSLAVGDRVMAWLLNNGELKRCESSIVTSINGNHVGLNFSGIDVVLAGGVQSWLTRASAELGGEHSLVISGFITISPIEPQPEQPTESPTPLDRRISVSAPGLSLMVSFALRYAYDRKTAAAHAVIAQVLPIFDQLPTSDQAQIRREVQRELDRGGLQNADDWERFMSKTGG